MKLLQQKKAALAKQTRRSLSQVLEEKKIESARIRIENVIQEDIYIELLEALEIYAELVLARCSTISNGQIHDERLREALHVMVYCSQYTDIKELQTLKPLIGHLVSKEFVQEASDDKDAIPPKILAKIHIAVPKTELVDLYLLEIAKAYNVEVPGVYMPPAAEETQSNTTTQSKNSEPTEESNEKAGDDIWARFAALKK